MSRPSLALRILISSRATREEERRWPSSLLCIWAQTGSDCGSDSALALAGWLAGWLLLLSATHSFRVFNPPNLATSLFFIDQLRSVSRQSVQSDYSTILTKFPSSCTLTRIQSGSIYVRPSPFLELIIQLGADSFFLLLLFTEFLSDVVLLTQKSRNVYKSR